VTYITATGSSTTYALTSDGSLHAWGYNHVGQLGDGTTTNRYSPVDITSSGSLSGKTVVEIFSGDYHGFALASDNSIHAWGNNIYGQLGDGTTTQRNSPVDITGNGSLSGKTVTHITGGTYHAIALASDGSVHGWGFNGYGQLGDGTTTTRTTPVLISGGSVSGKTITQISAGVRHTLALASDRTVHAWGDNEYGQIGDGAAPTDRTSPVDITNEFT